MKHKEKIHVTTYTDNTRDNTDNTRDVKTMQIHELCEADRTTETKVMRT